MYNHTASLQHIWGFLCYHQGRVRRRKKINFGQHPIRPHIPLLLTETSIKGILRNLVTRQVACASVIASPRIYRQNLQCFQSIKTR